MTDLVEWFSTQPCFKFPRIKLWNGHISFGRCKNDIFKATIIGWHRASPQTKIYNISKYMIDTPVIYVLAPQLSSPWFWFDRITHTHTHTPSACSCSPLSLLVIILHPTTLEPGCYLGWQNTQGLFLLLLSSDILVWSISGPASLCFQQSASDVSLCTKQMRAVSDGYSVEDPTANQQNLNNIFPFFFTSPDYVSHLNHFSSKGTITRQWMCDDEFLNLLPLFYLIESHYVDEMLFLRTKAIK